MDELKKYLKECETEFNNDTLKNCVFCGKKPKSKTKEHVIPKWLIKYTGNPKRLMHIPVLDFDSKEHTFKKISFDQFVFPACHDCNQHFATLEAEAKVSFIKLFEKKEICSHSAEILLDWFDKLRVGFWLAMQIWDKSPLFITPKFHIQSRLRLHDRLLYFSTCDEFQKGIRFTGINDPVFKCLPSFFGIRICNFMFVSASTIGLCGGALGLPRIKVCRGLDDRLGEVKVIKPPRPGWRSNWPAAPRSYHIIAQACYQQEGLEGITLDQNCIDRMMDATKSKPHLSFDDKLLCLDDNTVNLDLHKFKTSVDLDKSGLILYGKLRKFMVNDIPHHPDKQKRAWKRVLLRFIRMFPIGNK